jgi:hypothetical protein
MDGVVRLILSIPRQGEVLEYEIVCLGLESVATVSVHEYFLNFSSCTAFSDRTLTVKLTSVSSCQHRYLVVTNFIR